MTAISGPQAPALLQTLRWVADPLGYLEDNFQRYGDLFVGKVMPDRSVSLIFVNHPEALQQILTHDTREFSAPGEVNEILKSLLGENSVILLGGDAHRRRRQLIMPPFHGERLKAYGDLIVKITHTIIDQLPLEQPFAARDAMQQISMRVILQAVFGLYEGDRYQQLEQLLSYRLNLTGSRLGSAVIFFPALQKDLGPWSLGHKLQQMATTTDDLIYAEIRDRRAHPNPDRTDILSLLLEAKDEQGEGLSDEELRDELMTLLIAGHETTATALSWALYWVHYLPAVQQQLLAELNSLGDAPNPMDIVRLPYLTAVCNETLRIYPVAMLTFPRRVEQPTEILGYQLNPNDLLMGCIYLIHHRPDLYPNSHEFRPERFLERQFSPYEFVPFGGGSRRCVGAALAQYEMKLVLATILQRCQLRLAHPRPVRPQRRGVTLGPGDRGIQIVLQQRHPSIAAEKVPVSKQ